MHDETSGLAVAGETLLRPLLVRPLPPDWLRAWCVIFFSFWVLFCSTLLPSGIIAAILDAKKERFLLHPTFDLFLQVGGVWWHCDSLTIWNTQLKWEKIAKIYYFLLSIILVYEVGIFYVFCTDWTKPDWLKLILLQQLFWAWLEFYRRQFSSYSRFSSFRALRRSFLRPQCSLSWLSGRNRERDFPSILNEMLFCLFQPGYIFSSEVPNDHPKLSCVLHNDQMYKQGTHLFTLK